MVEDAVRREFDAQERRADAADTRAGFLLAFCALAVSLGAGEVWLPLALASRAFAAVAAVLALWVLATLSRSHLNVGELRGFLHRDPVLTRLTLLDSHVSVHSRSRRRIERKEARLRLASVLVTLAVAFALVGATVELLS